MADRQKLIELIENCFQKCLKSRCTECEYFNTPPIIGSIRSCQSHLFADYLIANGVIFYVHKTDNSMCLYCNNSMSGDAPDGSQVLFCFECAGHEGKEMIVGDDEYCSNYNGIE